MTKSVNEREIVLAVLMEVTERGLTATRSSGTYWRNTSILKKGSGHLSPV